MEPSNPEEAGPRRRQAQIVRPARVTALGVFAYILATFMVLGALGFLAGSVLAGSEGLRERGFFLALALLVCANVLSGGVVFLVARGTMRGRRWAWFGLYVIAAAFVLMGGIGLVTGHFALAKLQWQTDNTSGSISYMEIPGRVAPAIILLGAGVLLWLLTSVPARTFFRVRRPSPAAFESKVA